MKYLLSLLLLLSPNFANAGNISCDILVAFMDGNETIQTWLWIEGTILEETETEFVVDFSEGVARRKGLIGSPKSYSRMIIPKDRRCVKHVD